MLDIPQFLHILAAESEHLVTVTITLPDEQLEGIRALVACGEAASVSAFVKHAVDVGLSDAAG